MGEEIGRLHHAGTSWKGDIVMAVTYEVPTIDIYNVMHDTNVKFNIAKWEVLSVLPLNKQYQLAMTMRQRYAILSMYKQMANWQGIAEYLLSVSD